MANIAEVEVLGMAALLVSGDALLRRLVAAELTRRARHARVLVHQLVLDALTRILRLDVLYKRYSGHNNVNANKYDDALVIHETTHTQTNDEIHRLRNRSLTTKILSRSQIQIS